MPELWELSAEEIARRVRAREASAAEVLESCLARAARVEPLIGAFLEVFENESRARAAEIDRRAAAGEDPGPLAGVPVALKDNLSLTGRAVTCGSRILAGYVAPYTATAVERLIAAGAVPVARANMDELAMGSSCENSAYQLTRNPWDLARVPGGSSGGPAAAVAAGSVPLSFGSDTGGSIRQPAALCGVVGVKPSYGRVSRYGLVAFASSLDQIGPMARNVRDAALGLQVIAGADPRDTTTAGEPVGDYLEGIEEGIAGRRIGVIREIDAEGLGGDVARNWRESLDRLTAAGAELVEVSVPRSPPRRRARTSPASTACATASARPRRTTSRTSTSRAAARGSAPRSSGGSCSAPSRSPPATTRPITAGPAACWSGCGASSTPLSARPTCW
jgi:aspartyl-tRNA(Asn)/glutamyl-tRNA(Gln) amidotransferase subunit A